MDLPNRIYLVLNPIGMACASLVLLSIITLALIDRQLANRMTVRLIAVIAFTDLLAHVGEFYAVENYDLQAGTSLCTFVNGFRLFSRTFYCFTNIAICFHLYRGLVLLKRSSWKFELYTWIATLAMVTIFTLIYWGLGAFTGVVARKRCTPGIDNYTLNIVFTVIQATVNMVTVIIGVFTTIVGHRSLNKWINTYANSRSYTGDDQNRFKSDRKKMAERSFLYPLSTLITLPFEAIFLYLTASGIYVFNLVTLMALSTGLSGVLTAIAFAIDPAAHKAFKSAYNKLTDKSRSHKTINDGMSENTSIIPLEQKV
ncbi:hypothetical protein CONCODRAFT_3291 [Conidiobolus coronatus NRRL 28638]|uniref:G-protein coupled receptors family 1 profile domain-containing protein n=1 Tax=Conidiobolus coronatus (strain ATCC 28846 / CBS 209.66 / NRRL 28638) TaxID=796925 RepID=A0A137PFL9_CONC2|nr:hypothetical protein CONCODRAFT_3291 [Conidiobolus coronatus NRRL 28638]|eukprot:KXN73731.1 hypothetical protein CONCODRAFT_3291 [Conidiobolus coronatus NRRL 28638]